MTVPGQQARTCTCLSGQRQPSAVWCYTCDKPLPGRTAAEYQSAAAASAPVAAAALLAAADLAAGEGEGKDR